jgi:hypothetical protein
MRTSGVAALLFGLGAVAGAQDAAVDHTAPEQVTTDTLVYCRQLAARLEQLTQVAVATPTKVVDLSTAGKQMCEHGLTRAGILRLRSAIVMMLHDQDGDPAPGKTGP